jgi:hypothetical protein
MFRGLSRTLSSNYSKKNTSHNPYRGAFACRSQLHHWWGPVLDLDPPLVERGATTGFPERDVETTNNGYF